MQWMGSFTNYLSKPPGLNIAPKAVCSPWGGARTARMNQNSSEISSLMELEARHLKFSAPPSHRRYQVKNPVVQSCLIPQMSQPPTSSGGRIGESLVGLQMPWGAVPPSHRLIWTMRGSQLWQGPQSLVPHHHPKLLPLNDPHISCATHYYLPCCL